MRTIPRPNSPACLILTIFVTLARGEIERRFQVSELAAVGHRIGWLIGDGPPPGADPSHQNFYVVFPDPSSTAERLLNVNDRTGEITIRESLDYEREQSLTVLAIPADGQSLSIRAVIDVQDENDHAPQFPTEKTQLEISEYARINTEIALPPARDPDSGILSVQKYRIVSGNVNNIFRLSAHDFSGLMYLDLVVNGHLDREYRDRYDLVIEAVDGGQPPRTGRLEVNVRILDANDNSPLFLQSTYSARVPANASQTFPVIKVSAKDADHNLNRSGQSPPFSIDSSTGRVSVAYDEATESSLKPGAIYELIICAVDGGLPQPLESTALLTIQVDDPDEHGHGHGSIWLEVVWLTDDASARAQENLPVGYVLARVAVHGATNQETSLSLSGCDSICIKQTDSPAVYLLIVCGHLDRERHPSYRLNLMVRNSKSDDVLLDHPLHMDLLDVNDNAPEWNQTQWKFTWHYRPGQVDGSVYVKDENHIRLVAKDSDERENGRVRYFVQDTSLFTIDQDTGDLTMAREFDCGAENPEVRFKVVAEDNGQPTRLSSSVEIIVEIVDVNGQAPTFQHSLYEITVKEDLEVGSCILQVSSFITLK
ncbi:cadherin domain-containing protein [Ditylenchus destructor]|uniref:Cadherin domain-containing protein n=1 Tax=Ditylenchus destructor TaxID=166010 RepID=A0AAD4R1V6_9BILA|nr:cadherin domain-containing protein [Ditylenchus destructor]